METKGETTAAVAAHSFYISSPYLGLQKEREQAKQLITRRYHAYRDSYGGSTEPVVETCQGDVRRSDHYILILGERYGSRRPEHGGMSVTELEFEAAIESGRSPHAFFLNFVTDSRNGIERDPEAIQALEAFRKRVRNQCIPLDCQDMPDGRTGWEVFVEGITSLAASPPARPGDPPTPAIGRNYTPAELDDWVEQHFEAVAQQFEALPSVAVRRLHVDLPVELFSGGKRRKSLLQPRDLAAALEGAGSYLILITGTGGAGKTSLACRIARWGLGKDPERPLAEHPILPVLIDTALTEGETVLSRVCHQLEQATGTARGQLAQGLVRELLRCKRLLVIVDHFSELEEEARQRILSSLPTGLVVVTSRQSESQSLGEQASMRIEPLPIASTKLQPFFADYLELKGERPNFSEDELELSQKQLRRIVGSKPITPLLAQMFIDDVIAKKKERGLLAASVPQLMLAYVQRIDEPIRAEQRRTQEGLQITPALVERSLQTLALAGLKQLQEGRPRYKPLDFPIALAQEALRAVLPDGRSHQVDPLLEYLLEHKLLHHTGQGRSRLCFPLDPLADYLGAMAQLEQLLEKTAQQAAETVWRAFLEPLIERDRQEQLSESMGGFLLALRDCALDRLERDDAAPIPPWVSDQLGQLGGLDPQEERQRLAEQRTRRWVYELAVPEEDDRAAALERLAAMVAPGEGGLERAAARGLAGAPLARVAADAAGRPLQERCDAVVLLGLIADGGAIETLLDLMAAEEQPGALRRAAAEALGLSAAGAGTKVEQRQRITAALERQLRHQRLEVVVKEESDWKRIDAELPLLQGAARGLQLAASLELPLLGSGPGRVVPVLTLSALNKAEGEALEVRTEVLEEVPVWRLPLPQGQQLEMVLVPGGEYEIGSPESEAGRDVYPRFRQRCEGVNVEALRTVRLEPYAMVRFPISQAQWAAVAALPLIEREIAVRPGTYEAKGLWERYAQPGGLAVDSVSWFDCGEWLARLNHWLVEQWAALEGKVASPQLALPSESQWEVACRAGTSTPFHGGDTLDPSWANYEASYTYGRGRKGEHHPRPTATGAMAVVNRWGLAEMHGQLLEWCGDRWHPDPFGEGWPQEGGAWEEPDAALEGLQEHEYRLLRGGSWIGVPHGARAAYRLSNHPSLVSGDIGVRPCCLLPPGLTS